MPKGVSLNALRVLSTVAQTQSFKLAAQRLGVTQSAISRQIQTLESQLGTRLIQRDNRVHALTPTGSLMAPELNRIFAQLGELISSIHENKAADKRSLTVAVPDSLLSHFIAPRLSEFATLYPHLKLEFKTFVEYLDDDIGLHEQVQNQLLQDHWDVVVSCGDVASKQVASLIIAPLRYQQLVHTSGATSGLFSVAPSDDIASNADSSKGLDAHNSNQSAADIVPESEALSIQRVDTTSAALALVVSQGGRIHLPTYLLSNVLATLPLQPHAKYQPVRSKHNLYLRCFYPRHKERELAVVAFSNWLAHIGSNA